MLVALSDNHGELEHSEYWDPMVRVARCSDNAAANELLEQTGGSDADGAADMVELMKSLGLAHTDMAGGYLIEGGGGSSLLGVVDPPPPTIRAWFLQAPTGCRWPTRSAGWTTPTTMWPSFSPTTGRSSSPSIATASRMHRWKRSVKLRCQTYWQPTSWGKVLA